MRCLDDCHEYELDNFEAGDPNQKIRFYEIKKSYRKNGTTNEEVLRMLLHRLDELNFLFPCPENNKAITYLQLALYYINVRTTNRIKRGVEGKLEA